MDFIYENLTVFLEVPESLNVRVSLHTPCGKVTVCKNQDPVAVQNV
jgi:hypothetical protein